MSSSEEREYEIDRLERKLKEQEAEQRLRQMESEVNAQDEAKFYPITKYKAEQQEKRIKPLGQKVVLGLKLFGLGVVALVAVQIASVLARFLIVGALIFAAYQLFFKNRNRE